MEWISVEERLPEDGEEGLCVMHAFDSETNPKIVVPFRMVGVSWHPHFRDDDPEEAIEYAMDGELYAPTHWMPLPEPPK